MHNEATHRDALQKLRYATDVVVVIMRDQHVIDTAQSRILRGSYDTVRIAEIVARQLHDAGLLRQQDKPAWRDA